MSDRVEADVPLAVSLRLKHRNIRIERFGRTEDFLLVGIRHRCAEIELCYLLRVERLSSIVLFAFVERNREAVFALELVRRGLGIDDAAEGCPRPLGLVAKQ